MARSVDFMEELAEEGARIHAHTFMPLAGTPWAARKGEPIPDDIHPASNSSFPGANCSDSGKPKPDWPEVRSHEATHFSVVDRQRFDINSFAIPIREPPPLVFSLGLWRVPMSPWTAPFCKHRLLFCSTTSVFFNLLRPSTPSCRLSEPRCFDPWASRSLAACTPFDHKVQPRRDEAKQVPGRDPMRIKCEGRRWKKSGQWEDRRADCAFGHAMFGQFCVSLPTDPHRLDKGADPCGEKDAC